MVSVSSAAAPCCCVERCWNFIVRVSDVSPRRRVMCARVRSLTKAACCVRACPLYDLVGVLCARSSNVSPRRCFVCAFGTAENAAPEHANDLCRNLQFCLRATVVSSLLSIRCGQRATLLAYYYEACLRTSNLR